MKTIQEYIKEVEQIIELHLRSKAPEFQYPWQIIERMAVNKEIKEEKKFIGSLFTKVLKGALESVKLEKYNFSEDDEWAIGFKNGYQVASDDLITNINKILNKE